MGKTKGKSESKKAEKQVAEEVNDATKLQEEQATVAEETPETDKVTEPATDLVACEELKKKYDELNDSHLRLMAEYDNYRKRTLREKSELLKSGTEGALVNLLPVIDDIERAIQNIRSAESVDAVVEGIDLIYNKFNAYLTRQSIKPIETIGLPFDAETSEAIALIPAPTPEMKGKVIDCVQTGYMLHDKVIRHAKVVVGE